MSAGSEEPQLSGSVMFYHQPEPLSLERHARLGVKRVDAPFLFLLQSHVVPITVNEFGVAAASYPVIFAGPEKTPLAVMGARAGDNVFVGLNGEVDPEAYLPAFARRYPFVFAADPGSDRLLVCIDRAAPMIGEQPDVPFFEGEQPSRYTQDAIEFCTEFERHRRNTEEFTKILSELDLFEEKTVTLTGRNPDGSDAPPQKVADYFAISEEKLNALSPEAFLRLRDQGVLGPTYAHLVSLLLWPKIIQRALMRAESMAQADMRASTPLA
ncbi:MAG: peptidase [Alphaproteobacteria bacterium]|jgi:hypothetical protein|nr:peptidase [Alphaproteobacteria bacterium]